MLNLLCSGNHLGFPFHTKIDNFVLENQMLIYFENNQIITTNFWGLFSFSIDIYGPMLELYPEMVAFLDFR